MYLFSRDARRQSLNSLDGFWQCVKQQFHLAGKRENFSTSVKRALGNSTALSIFEDKIRTRSFEVYTAILARGERHVPLSFKEIDW